MATISIEHRDGAFMTEEEIDLSTFAALTRGTAILNVAVSDALIEIELSENLLLKIQNDQDGAIKASISSTVTSDESAPTRLQIVAEDEYPSAAVVEDRLHSLRELYAMMVLLEVGPPQIAGLLGPAKPETP